MPFGPRIAIDFSSLDRVGPFGGQYRYTVDLVRGLAELRPEQRVLFDDGRMQLRVRRATVRWSVCA